MKFLLIPVLSLLTALLTEGQTSDFLTEQKRFIRVREAYSEKGDTVSEKLKSVNLGFDNLNIIIIAYKAEKELDIYVKSRNDTKYQKLVTYDICSLSGQLGPKRRQGDMQVPEGFYHIDRFNPTSNFYLSLGINYPNRSDRIKSNASNLGGDIFIHGNCVTIGCLAMTDDKIKEIYIYAIQARHNGQHNIPVYIFPFKMTEENMSKYTNLYKSEQLLLDFWNNLKTGYDRFQQEMQALNVAVDAGGDYTF